MHRIDGLGAYPEMPEPRPPGPAGFFGPGNPDADIPVPATIVTHEWANSVQEELLGILEAAGIPPDVTKKVNNQTAQAIQKLLAALHADVTARLEGVKEQLSEGFDAGKITSGVIGLDRLPAAALERLYQVNTYAQMYALTTQEVQNGDTVRVAESAPAPGMLYRVVDDAKLHSPDGYVQYTAGRAAAVDWGGVENRPEAFAPSAHKASHAAGGADALIPEDIGALPANGKAASAVMADAAPWAGVTGKPAAFAPSAHKASHAAGGADALAPGDIGALPANGKAASAATADAVPWAGVSGKPAAFAPSAHKANHATGGSDALMPADIGALPVNGKAQSAAVADVADAVAWNNVSGKPLTFATSAHKASHATGGADALAPGDIGALPATGTAASAATADAAPWAGVTGKPAAFAPSAHKASHATGGSDALTPADIGAQAAVGITALGGTPSTQAFGDAAANGTAASVARSDHKHAMPAAPTTITGNAGTATALQTARTIGGVSFNGTANINLPGVNQDGNQNTAGTAAGITGLTLPAGTAAPGANAIVRTQANGYTYLGYINSNVNAEDTQVPEHIPVFAGGAFLRKHTPDAFRRHVGVPLVTKTTAANVGSALTVMPRIVIANTEANAKSISNANADAIVLYPA